VIGLFDEVLNTEIYDSPNDLSGSAVCVNAYLMYERTCVSNVL
jgi:hypothetical protein